MPNSSPNTLVKRPSFEECLELLRQLISTPSFSKEEHTVSYLLANWLSERGVLVQRHHLNLWATNRHFSPDKPNLLLNSHLDTVRPHKAYTRDPFLASVTEDKLYGLGSNDAGGALVSLLATFLHFYEAEDLEWNVIFAASVEEEISGPGGMASLREVLPPLTAAIVGEPTEMQMAIAEKGLMVIDGIATGPGGHAAHLNPQNALYFALDDIQRIRSIDFPKTSELLGKVRASVTQIEAGTQHNVVPASCKFVIDVRTNECYSNEEVFAQLQELCKSKLTARSFRLQPSGISADHPLVQSGLQMGRSSFGSGTLSDQVFLPCPSFKMGPGDTKRSHSADEFIFLEELKSAPELYIELISPVITTAHTP